MGERISESAKVELSRSEQLELAKTSLTQAREYAKSVSRESHASVMLRSAIRDMACSLGEIDAALSEVGTSKTELKSLIAPPELKLTEKEVEDLWKWVIEGDEGEHLAPVPEFKD